MAYAFVGGPVGSAPVAWQPVGAPLKAYSLSTDAGSYTQTGEPVAAGYGSNPSAGAYTISGNAVSVTRTYIFHVSDGSYAVKGYDTELDEQHKLYVDQGAYDISGNPAGLAHYNIIYPDKGTYAVTGVDATFAITMGEDGGDYLITGNAVDFLKGYRVNLETGSFTWTLRFVDMQQSGQPILYTDGSQYNIDFKTFIAYSMKALYADRGPFKVQGYAVFLSFGYALKPVKGVYSLTGRPVNFPITMPAENGFYDFIGIDAYRDVRYNPPNTGHYTFTGRSIVFNIGLPVDKGVYSIALSNAVTKHDFALPTVAGSFSISGQTAALRKLWAVQASTGSYSVTLFPQTVSYVRNIAAAKGTYAITGVDPELDDQRKMYLASARYTITGNQINFLKYDTAYYYDTFEEIIIAAEPRIISVAA